MKALRSAIAIVASLLAAVPLRGASKDWSDEDRSFLKADCNVALAGHAAYDEVAALCECVKWVLPSLLPDVTRFKSFKAGAAEATIASIITPCRYALENTKEKPESPAERAKLVAEYKKKKSTGWVYRGWDFAAVDAHRTRCESTVPRELPNQSPDRHISYCKCSQGSLFGAFKSRSEAEAVLEARRAGTIAAADLWTLESYRAACVHFAYRAKSDNGR